MTLNCFAIDDEPLALRKLENFIEQIPHVNLTNTFSNCMDAIPVISDVQPDIIFLDIQMDYITGIQLLETSRITSQIIIISAFEQYALKGYELNICDYILKPYSIDRLIQAIEKAKQLTSLSETTINQTNRDYIFIKTDYRIVKNSLVGH